MSEKWITIPNWPRFQHYGLRNPTWIKNYIGLLHKDEYLDLSLAERGILHGLWLAYADRDGRLRRTDVSAVLLQRAREAHLDSLSHAGLIEYSASKPMSLSLDREDARARARPQKDRSEERARNWIRNGSASEVPAGHLADVLLDEFKNLDSEAVDRLVAQAQEFRL